MRSDLVFAAMTHIHDRHHLCRLVAKATRKMHRPNTRVQDTINKVLLYLNHEGLTRRHASTQTDYKNLLAA